MTLDVDLVIAGATIVDGTGAPGAAGTVAVVDDRLVLLPPVDEGTPAIPDVNARRVIDARGLVVAPGFIDLHSHGGLVMLAEPLHEPKVRQGVTTELIGVDGNAYAPFPSARDLDDFVVLNAGLDGRPDIAYDWSTVPEYLARYDRRVAVNVAYVVGNTPLRVASVGWDEAEADEAAVADQRARLREALEAGAFGLSTGLDYPPGSYASTAELAALAGEAARLGGIYHTHVRYPLGDGFLDPFREAIEIGRRSGAPVHITHFYHRPTFPGPPEALLALVDDARAEGLDVTFDLYPSEWASTRLLIMLPTWVQDGGLAPLRERLADGAVGGRRRRGPPGPGTSAARAAGCSRAPGRGTTCGLGRSPRRSTSSGRAGRSARTSPPPASTRWTRSATSCWPRTCGSTRSRRARTGTASAGSSSTRRRWSAPTA